MSNQVISHATTASENSNQLISEFGTAQVNIKENSEVLQQKIRDIKELVEMIQNRITEIAEESKKRDEETLTTASQNSSQLLSEFGAAQVNIEEINKGWVQRISEIGGLILVLQNQMGEIAEETKKRDEEIMQVMNQVIKNNRVSQIIIICSLSISVIAFIGILLIYFRVIAFR